MRSVVVVGALLAGCYSPPREAPCTLACTAATGCPSGLECNGATCTLPGGSCEGGDGGLDADPIGDAPGVACYGKSNGKGLLRLCFDAPPTGAMTLTTQLIVTDDMTPTGCTVMREAPNAPDVCVIAGESITLPAAETLTVRGTLPLVLLASSELRVEGQIDAAARAAIGSAPGALPVGSALCPTGSAPLNGGGGAGGSFGGAGGNGGKGDGVSTAGGAGPSAAPAVVRGGCPGQAGHDAGTPGNAGLGGGAVYLIAGSLSIPSTALVNVSGGGGGGAIIGSGGGGGGSGGLIGVDTASLSYGGGILVANGGGGGCGVVDGNGTAGSDPSPSAPQARAPGCGGGGAGAGGAGSSPNGAVGNSGSGTGDSGDGGGGGVGDIVFFGPTAPASTTNISPPVRHVP